MQVIAKAVLKIALALILLLFLLIGGLLLALRIPSVQTQAVQKAAAWLSESIHHKVTIGAVNIKPFKSVVLDKVRVLDNRGQELFYIGNLDADISVFSVFHPNKLSIATLTLTEPHANFTVYKGTNSSNLSAFIDALSQLIKPDTTTTTSKPFEFAIDRVVIKNGYFSYDNQNIPAITHTGMDYKHMKIGRISADLSGIELRGDTIKADIKGLTAIDLPSDTYLKNLDVKMTFAPTFWEWKDMDLKVGKSNLRHYVRFDYKHLFNFVDFNDSVNVTASLDSSAVFSDDIAHFAPQLIGWNESVVITADAKGKTNRFDAKNVDIVYGKNTHIVGNVSATGLPDYKETFAELHLKPSTINAQDLKRYIPAEAYSYAQKFGTIKLKGNFTGFYYDFVANGDFKTALGNFNSDINLKLNKNNARSSYKGYLKTDNFQIGKLIGNTDIIQSISMDGSVQGTGFDAKSARLQMDASVNAVKIYGYNYRNITTDGKFSKEAFKGKFDINDPNLKIQGNGTINLAADSQRFDLTAKIDRANFKNLNLTKQDLKLKTDATLNFTGLKIDEMFGSAAFRNTTVTYEGKPLTIDSLLVVSARTPAGRSLFVNSEILALNAAGNFQYTTFFKDLGTLVKEYELNFKNNATATANYYARKSQRDVPPDYGLDFDLTLKNANPVLQLFVPELALSANSKIDGTFRNGQTAIFTFGGQIDTVLYGKAALYKNAFELSTSKLPLSPEVLAQAFYTSKTQDIPAAGKTENFFVEGIWNDQKIQFSSNLAQSKTTNRASISGDLSFLEDRLQVVFNKSTINILDKAWTISPQNVVDIKGKEIDIKNLVLSYQNQTIGIAGKLSENSTEALRVTVSNFNLDNLNPLMSQKMRGTLNSQLYARDVYNQVILASNLKIDSLYFDDVLIGDISGDTDWEQSQKRLQVNLGISRDNQKVLAVNGTYNPDGGDQELNLLAVMENTQIKIVEPFLKSIMTDMEGTMSGRIRILGKLTGPILKGVANVSNGRFTFTYLNTVYSFSDRVYFAENGITFKKILLKDMYGNTGTLTGGVYHDGFQNMMLDMKADFRKLMVLNTTREQNDLYYGTAIATGDVSVFGPTDNLTINVNARSEKGTRLAIPLNNQAKASRQNFIRFVNANVTDSTGAAALITEQKVDLSGINLNMNLDATDDAYIEIIFDERTGDIVRGTGNGRIRMNIDTRGEFNMYGQYEVSQGAYNYTLGNLLVNKEFSVRPGGTISWNGDPYAGVLDLSAIYTQRVSLTDVLLQNASTSSETENNATTDRRRYPVTVVMGLTGNLLNPEIKLDLEFNDVPSQVEALLQPFISSIRSDEQELNRQVFSLLVFKRFSPVGEFSLGNAGGDALTSISEFFTNSIGNLLSQVDSNLEVDIGLSSLEAGNTELQTRIGYTFMDGRLRVSRESSLSGNTSAPGAPNSTNNNSAAVFGDWRAEYYLRPDGKLRLKLQYVTSGVSYLNNAFTTSSASLVHTEQFDSFRELFRRKKPSRKERAAQDSLNIKNAEDEPSYRVPDTL